MSWGNSKYRHGTLRVCPAAALTLCERGDSLVDGVSRRKEGERLLERSRGLLVDAFSIVSIRVHLCASSAEHEQLLRIGNIVRTTSRPVVFVYVVRSCTLAESVAGQKQILFEKA